MGDFADAAFECFGPRLDHHVLEELFEPYTCAFNTGHEHTTVVIEKLTYGGEAPICAELQVRAVPYAFLHTGDHEHAFFLRAFVPGLGEWIGCADADGRPLVPVAAIEVALIEEIAVITGSAVHAEIRRYRAIARTRPAS